jgi:hypothetical protein
VGLRIDFDYTVVELVGNSDVAWRVEVFTATAVCHRYLAGQRDHSRQHRQARQACA